MLKLYSSGTSSLFSDVHDHYNKKIKKSNQSSCLILPFSLFFNTPWWGGDA